MAKSHAQIVLENIEAALENRSSVDVQQYQIAGREIVKIPILELMEIRKQYNAELAQEKAADDVKQGLGNPRNIKVKF